MKRAPWRIKQRKKAWPITIGRGRSYHAPVWVWGDLKLAEKIVRLLNNT